MTHTIDKNKAPSTADRNTRFKIFYQEQLVDLGALTFFHHHLLPNGTPWLSLAKIDSCYLLRYNNLLDVMFDPKKREIHYYPTTNLDQISIDHLIADQVLPLIHSFYGLTHVHASAVVIQIPYEHASEKHNQEVIAFIGDTGQGKSTLTASLCRVGYPVFTDDCLALEESHGHIIGYPGNSTLRLWSDSVDFLYGEVGVEFQTVAQYTTKKRVNLNEVHGKFFKESAPIRRIYFLDNSADRDSDPEIEITPLSPKQAFIELFTHAFRLDITDKERLRQEFDILTQISLYPIFFRLSYPRDYSRLADVQQAILQHAMRETQ